MRELILWYGGAILLTAILVVLGSRYQSKRKEQLQKWHEEDMANLRRLIARTPTRKSEGNDE